MATIQKIIPNLWFEKEAREAAEYYTSIFPNSGIGRITYYGKEGYEHHGMPEGTVLTVEFRLEGQEFVGLNGGPAFTFNEAISFIVNCTTQEEVDHYWDRLSQGGDEKAQACGWLKDRFGLSWQIVPTALSEMIADPDREKVGRVMSAMFRMKKLDIAALQKAYEG